MTPPSWIGIAISVLVMLGGTAVNLFIIGRFVGQWGEAMKNIAATLAKVEHRIEEIGVQGDAVDNKQGLMEARLVSVESGVDRFWKMRDEFVTMRTTVELVGKHQADKLESVSRSISVIERQLGSLVGSKAGFTTLSSEGDNR